MSISGISFETKEDGKGQSLVLHLNLTKPGYTPKPFTTIEECATEFMRMWNECDGGKRADGDNYTLMIAADPVMGAIHSRLSNEFQAWFTELNETRKTPVDSPAWMLKFSDDILTSKIKQQQPL
jgi:hypothetical protein